MRRFLFYVLRKIFNRLFGWYQNDGYKEAWQYRDSFKFRPGDVVKVKGTNDLGIVVAVSISEENPYDYVVYNPMQWKWYGLDLFFFKAFERSGPGFPRCYKGFNEHELEEFDYFDGGGEKQGA